jgi:hypothetical protein
MLCVDDGSLDSYAAIPRGHHVGTRCRDVHETSAPETAQWYTRLTHSIDIDASSLFEHELAQSSRHNIYEHALPLLINTFFVCV